MSQAKVDKYKEEKLKRDQLIKKEKRILFLEKTAGVLVAVAVVGWLGWSVYGQVQAAEDAKVTETVMDATAIDEYFTSLQEDTAASAETAEGETEEVEGQEDVAAEETEAAAEEEAATE